MARKLTDSLVIFMTLSWILFSFICISCIHAVKKDTQHKLIFLQIISRHGERAPLYFYPTDPNPIEVWVTGLGKLTQRGKRQQYEVGKVLRTVYDDFITSNPNEVFVNSTMLEYSLQSAETLMASMYAPTPEWEFVDGFEWQPIPVHYTPDPFNDGLLIMSPCKRMDEEKEKVVSSPDYKKDLEKFQPMLEVVTAASGLENDAPYYTNIVIMADTLKMEVGNGLIIPSWAQYYWDEIHEFCEFIFNSWFSSKVTLNIAAGLLVQTLVENMEMKMAGELPERKVQVYSCHDLNIVYLLMVMETYTGKYPPISTTMTLELYESPNDQKTVRVLLLNSTAPENGYQEPYVLIMKGCTEYCPYEHFLNITKDILMDTRTWDEKCENEVE